MAGIRRAHGYPGYPMGIRWASHTSPGPPRPTGIWSGRQVVLPTDALRLNPPAVNPAREVAPRSFRPYQGGCSSPEPLLQPNARLLSAQFGYNRREFLPCREMHRAVGSVRRGSASARFLYVRLAPRSIRDFLLSASYYEGRLAQDATALHANFCPPKRTGCHHAMSCRRDLHA